MLSLILYPFSFFGQSSPDDTGERLSGFLLRSDVVSGWPGLLADAFDADEGRLEPRRTERLSDNVLICIYDGILRKVEIHQKAEMRHFGFDSPDEHAGRLHKLLRNEAGVKAGATLPEIPWRDEGRRVVDVGALASSIQGLTARASFTSAQFALQMIEGVEKVALQINGL